MVQIVVSAHNPIGQGAIVTGYLVARDKPSTANVIPCKAMPLLRVYSGYGKVRAETGTKPPRKGFGTLISGAEICDREVNRGMKLWLRVED